MSRLTVRRAGSADRDALIEAFRVANVDEVVTAWVLEGHSPDLYRESEYVPERIDMALDADAVWIAGTDDEIWALSIWQHMTSLERMEAEVAAAHRLADATPELRPLRRIAQATDLLLRTHPREFPHDYLEVIVTMPQRRGQGAGGAILADRLDAATHSGVPAYLEASTRRSSRLYARRGFVESGEPFSLPEGGPTLIPMWFRP